MVQRLSDLGYPIQMGSIRFCWKDRSRFCCRNLMNLTLLGAFFAVGLAVGIVALLEVGRRIGAKKIEEEGETAASGFGAIEGAIFGLMGLILAFSFSGALARFDARRQLVVEEANDIGTAWLRIDLLNPEAQIPMRDLFRRYLDSRIETYRKVPDMAAVRAELGRMVKLQEEIWSLAVASTGEAKMPAAPILFLPALNAMIDITTTRTEAIRIHPPVVIFVMLGTLTLACSLFAGYDMAAQKRLNPSPPQSLSDRRLKQKGLQKQFPIIHSFFPRFSRKTSRKTGAFT